MSASGTSPITLVAKTCLVTGGAGGLGKAIAAEFLRAGANVVICDIHEQRVQAASAELSAMGPLLALSLDITNATAVEDMFDQIRTRFGTIHVLVNNAAIMDRFDPVAEVEPQLWDRILAVNLTAPFLLTKLALQVMLQQENRDASIINIASGAAKAGWLAGENNSPPPPFPFSSLEWGSPRVHWVSVMTLDTTHEHQVWAIQLWKDTSRR